MGTRSLFELLTGYEEPASADAGAPELLGGSDLEDGAGDQLPSEAEFDRILEELQAQADTDPQFARKLSDAFDVADDLVELKARLAEARAMVARAHAPAVTDAPELLGGSDASGEDLEEALLGPELLGVPNDFSDRYVERFVEARYREGFPRIDLEPKSHRFEDDHPLGWLGWFVFNGPGAVKVPRGSAFPFPEQFGRIPDAEKFVHHGNGEPFVYRLDPPDSGEPLRIALFADFGTGLGHSRFIARQLEVDRYDAAVHLGDVYYTGRTKEYRNYFEKPLRPVMEKGTRLFVIPDNHDGYSGFHAYTDFRKEHLEQHGSYFAIETPHVQLIGVDTIWHSDRGRLQDSVVCDWLRDRLAAGRAAKRANVLMTGHEPYSYGKPKLTELHRDVVSLAGKGLDLWFWGNTHYCALFDRLDSVQPGDEPKPYYGSCIGHGGYPYRRKNRSDAAKSPANVRFVEAGSRYEEEVGRHEGIVRPNRGMNGFCALEIDPSGDVRLEYRDWRGTTRCVAPFARQADGSLMLGTVDDRTRPGA